MRGICSIEAAKGDAGSAAAARPPTALRQRRAEGHPIIAAAVRPLVHAAAVRVPPPGHPVPLLHAAVSLRGAMSRGCRERHQPTGQL